MTHRFRILISAFLVYGFFCSGSLAKSDATQLLHFEGEVVLEVRAPKGSSTRLLNASDRVPDADLDGMIAITTGKYEIMIMVSARPSTWTDEILLNFMKVEYGAPLAPADDLQIKQSPNAIETFPDNRIKGIYQTLIVENSYAEGELLVHSGGFVLGNLWIDLMFSTPADSPASIQQFLEFPLRFSISHELDDGFLSPDDYSVVQLQATNVK